MFALALYALAGLGKVDSLEGTPPYDDPDSIKFYLWTKQNPYDESLPDRGAEKFTAYNVNGSKEFSVGRKTKMFIHGFVSDGIGFSKDFVDAYIKMDSDYNYIGMDWQKLAGVHLDVYATSAGNIRLAAAHAALFLSSWVDHYQVPAEDIHLIGHSLGAQVAARLGKIFNEAQHHGTIGRISGLDPAGPLFVDDVLDDYCLTKTDAKFVDVIHTNGAQYRPFVIRGYFGNLNPMGDVDFFVNGGSWQPGCWNLIPQAYGACSHGRSVEVYVESITNRKAFGAKYCTSMSRCEWGTTDGGEVIHMGEYCLDDIEDPESVAPEKGGWFYLATNDHSPYSKAPGLTRRLDA